ncbi:MAG: hypothetical protein QM738_14530 [Ferruginibacter sp.]
MQQLLSYDRELFRLINYKWHNSFFDGLMPILRSASTWYPLYFFLLLLVVSNYRKTGWWWVIFCAGTVFLANVVSSQLIKEKFSSPKALQRASHCRLGKGIGGLQAAKQQFYFFTRHQSFCICHVLVYYIEKCTG